MATRWDVTKAVRASDLPAPSRLVMLVLADVAEVGTAEIPERFTPSLAVLTRETGLNESTVTRHLKALEKAGWVTRERPSDAARARGERTRYRLDVPRDVRDSCMDVHAEDMDPSMQDAPTVHAQSTEAPRTEHGPSMQSAPSYKEEVRSSSDQFRSSDRSSSPKAPKRRRARTTDAPRPDVDEICTYLADKIEGNGSKRPTITKTWHTEARLLLDEPRPIQPTVEKVKALIDWCQDPKCFWHKNILSMPTLRKQYDRVRLDALDEFNRKRDNPQGHETSRKTETHDGRRVSTNFNDWEQTG